MGVHTHISLDELNKLFVSYNFIKIIPTKHGIMDTTYIVFNDESGYILKKYERDIPAKITQEIKLLQELHAVGLNTPLCLDSHKEWYLYKKLNGVEPSVIQSYHIQALARFLAKLHLYSYKKNCNFKFIDSYDISNLLTYTKKNFYAHYKKLQCLQSYTMQNDGFIHGDIFKDNTVFDGDKIGVFDFIDSGEGSFSFDCAVGLVGFERVNNFSMNLFLNTYNQKAPQKLTKTELLYHIKVASKLYALLRINKYKNTKKAKKLLNF